VAGRDLNAPRFTGRAGAYEVWYVTVNEPGDGVGAWIRYTTFSPAPRVAAEPYAALWAAIFTPGRPPLAGRAKFPLKAFSSTTHPFWICVGEAELNDAGCRGSFESDTAEFAWDLRWQSLAEPVAFLPRLIEIVSPVFQAGSHPALTVEGSLTVNGETFRFEHASGSQQHTGGTTHALEWNWGHCSRLADEPRNWFGGVTALARRRGPIELAGTLAGLETAGGRQVFNSTAKVLVGRRQMSVQEWRPQTGDRRVVLRARVRPRPQELVGVTYDDPQGGTRTCYHSETADLDVWLERRAKSGSETLFEAHERRAAAFEYGSSQAVPGLPLAF
jgi:hypothetical protein